MDSKPVATLLFGVVPLVVCVLFTGCSKISSSGSPGGSVADSRTSGDATIITSERDSLVGCARGSAVGEEKAGLAAAPRPRADPYEVDPDLVVSDLSDATGEEGLRYVTGTVRSRSGQYYTYVELNILVRGAGEEMLELVTVNKVGLEPAEVWAFEAIVRKRDAKSYQVARAVAM